MELQGLFDRFADNGKATVVEIDGTGSRTERTHAQIAAAALERAALLRDAGVTERQVIGLQGPSGIDWVLWDLAALALGAVVQAFPDEMPLGDVDTLLDRHGLAVLVTDRPELAAHPAAVALDGSTGGGLRAAAAPPVTDADLHSLVYSSGTSGALKGLRVSRSGTEYVVNRFLECFPVGPEDRHLIFLPLANFQQRLSLYCCLWTGMDLVLTPFPRVFAALREERPTFVIAPPVFYDTVLQLHRANGRGVALADFLGSRMKFMITGMAPIRRTTLDAFDTAGVVLLEAYGMTESGMIAWNTPEARRTGSVGRLIDPEAVEFLPDGELLVRRPAPLSRSYFETAGEADGETFRPDGTILTGDFGRLDEDGYLYLEGRKKDLIALGSGRKVNPAEIERAYAGLEGVADLVVVPTPRGHGLGALVVPTPPGSAGIREEIRRQITARGADGEPHRRIVQVVFTEQPVRAEQRFMTANLKLSRPAVAAYFAELAGQDADRPGAAR